MVIVAHFVESLNKLLIDSEKRKMLNYIYAISINIALNAFFLIYTSTLLKHHENDYNIYLYNIILPVKNLFRDFDICVCKIFYEIKTHVRIIFIFNSISALVDHSEME